MFIGQIPTRKGFQKFTVAGIALSLLKVWRAEEQAGDQGRLAV